MSASRLFVPYDYRHQIQNLATLAIFPSSSERSSVPFQLAHTQGWLIHWQTGPSLDISYICIHFSSITMYSIPLIQCYPSRIIDSLSFAPVTTSINLCVTWARFYFCWKFIWFGAGGRHTSQHMDLRWHFALKADQDRDHKEGCWIEAQILRPERPCFCSLH